MTHFECKCIGMPGIVSRTFCEILREVVKDTRSTALCLECKIFRFWHLAVDYSRNLPAGFWMQTSLLPQKNNMMMETPPFITIWRCLSYWTWGFPKSCSFSGVYFAGFRFVFFAAKVRWIPGGFLSRTGGRFFSRHFWVFIGLFFWVDPLNQKVVCLYVFVCFLSFFLRRESSHQWPDKNQVAEFD